MKSPVTLLDVAAAAEVSKSTVANVFNRPERVRPELRQHVLDVAHALGFAGPDARGRLLSSGKANVIGVVPSGEGITWIFDDPYMRRFLATVAEQCQERRTAIQLIDGYGEAGAETIRRTVVDGLILHTADQVRAVDPALRRKMPVVVMDRTDDPDVSAVSIDDRGGARALARHLIGLGHRRFVITMLGRSYVAPVLHPPAAGARKLVSTYDVDEERLAGVGEALAEAGLSLGDMPIVEACGSSEETRLYGSAADLVLDNLGAATAVIVLGGELALGLLAAARRRGIAVPRDLSVAGFDDPPAATHSDPPLTAIAAPVAETARLATRLLFSGGAPQHIELPVELVVRGSTGPPPNPA
ncbi:LacI family DNA-binding transcriptional regulator [Devosia sp.]|uniref:LacI family DNA-binding transcriptional regulator n=1 Tax=Devosia sp. TaxID=1871048 RepID=UPI001AC3C609|nr:LacI family DNA-binding transcriptional regulator [Devosia sp.]MBN9308678.1 LacI family DNA-binding transcriptional regulator [Devosia sp.]